MVWALRAGANRRGIMHRDLKPENLLLVDGSPDSIVKVGCELARVTVFFFGCSRRPHCGCEKSLSGRHPSTAPVTDSDPSLWLFLPPTPVPFLSCLGCTSVLVEV